MGDIEVSLSAHVNKPLIWSRLSCGVRIEDLQDDRFEAALTLMKKYFIMEEATCRSSKLFEDPESVESFMNTVHFWMSDKASLCAVVEETGEVVGILLARIISKSDHTLTYDRMRVKITKGEPFRKIMELRSHMMKEFDVYDHFGVDSVFGYYAICIHPNHRGYGIGMALLQCGENLAKFLKTSIVVGIFTGLRSQTLVEKLGMTKLMEVYYSTWLENNAVVFDDPGAGNYSAMLMGKKIDTVEHPKRKSFTLGQGLKPLLEIIDKPLKTEEDCD